MEKKKSLFGKLFSRQPFAGSTATVVDRALAARSVPGEDVSGQIRYRADMARDRRDWRQAAQGYEEYLVHVVDDAPIWTQLGHARKEQSDLGGAEMAYRRAIAIRPTDADPYVHLGHALKLQSRYVEAQTAYEEAVRLDEHSPVQAELLMLRSLEYQQDRDERNEQGDLGQFARSVAEAFSLLANDCLGPSEARAKAKMLYSHQELVAHLFLKRKPFAGHAKINETLLRVARANARKPSTPRTDTIDHFQERTVLAGITDVLADAIHTAPVGDPRIHSTDRAFNRAADAPDHAPLHPSYRWHIQSEPDA